MRDLSRTLLALAVIAAAVSRAMTRAGSAFVARLQR